MAIRHILAKARASFVVRWTAAAVAAWFVIGVILAATGDTREGVWVPRLEAPVLMAVYVAIGLVVSSTQGLALRPQGRVAGRWFVATLAGTIMGGALSLAIAAEPVSASGGLDWLTDMLFIVVAVAVLQYAALLPDFRGRALRWPLLKFGVVVVTAVLGTVAFFGVGMLFMFFMAAMTLGGLAPTLATIDTAPLPVISGATLGDVLGYGVLLSVYGLVFGGFSGAALLWVCRKGRSEDHGAILPDTILPPA